MQDGIAVSLFDAHVKAFETGALLEVPFKPEGFFNAHLKIKGMKNISQDHGRYFEDAVLRVKLYDAGRRIKQVVRQSVRNRLKTDFGYKPDGNYIRIENHYKRPEIRFKKGPLLVADLVGAEFGERCKNDLVQTYDSIMQRSTYQLPTSKKNLSTSNLYLLAPKEAETRFGFNAEELISSTLKTIPDGVLTKEDYKKRLAKIRKDLKRLTSSTSGKSAFDISEKLREVLGFRR